ncbi:MAG: branched-chain amino acid ABC transporter permease [Leifsonia sp.]|mgnify:CR=1 FL=1|jgi:branched-chain amino acid transport system permease protein|uniref:Branched-chain amino acid ABC transporter permease n=1 Tax=Microcella pacifica TaxID=2591847 RepID=A0A9E5JLT0_9MICO|nr:branched-chain amino acid ABC transporter permease [Microcella pacifica]MBR21465.1 branched-chain amino acid ABC transporter permease [Leifsonia sp.]NHF62909.1 branched-chain amino acid ABC transporter permease [Microcella pacifica]
MTLIDRIRTARATPWVIGGALILVFALLPVLNLSLPGVLPGATYTPGTLQLLAFAMVFATLALSYHLLFGVAGLLSFGHALYFAVGAYGLGIVLRDTQLALVPAMGVVLLGAVVLAAALGALSLRVTGIAFAMVTLAFAQAGSVLVRRNAAITNGEEGLPLEVANIPSELVGVINTRNLYWIALGMLVVVFLIVTWFERSRAGHVVVAARENDLRVRVLGMTPFSVRLITVVLAGTLAALVGMVYLLLQSGVTPAVTTPDFTLTLLVIVVLGGVGSRWGAVVGGLIYTLLDQRLTALSRSEAIADLPDVLRIPLSEPLFILGTLFILVVVLLPGGLAGLARRATARLARRRPESERPLEEAR